MMAGNGIFSLGLAGLFIFFLLGHGEIGLLFSGAAIVARFQAEDELYVVVEPRVNGPI